MRPKLGHFCQQWLTTVMAKLAIGIMLIIGCMSAFIYFFFPEQLERQVLQTVTNNAEAYSMALSFAAGKALTSDDPAMAERIMEVARQIENIDYIVVQDDNGNIFRSLNLDAARKLNYDLSDEVNSSNIFRIRRPIIIDNKRVGVLFIGISLANARNIISDSHKNAAGIGVFFLVLGLIAIVALHKYINKPIVKITDVVKNIANGDLFQRVQIESVDDIGALGKTINVMLDGWEMSRREWGMLNKGLEERVAERTLKLEEEINERKRAEEDLRLFMARLERSNRELEDFAFVASHDLQEPLRKVQAFGDRLKAVCGDELSEKAATYLDRMQSAANRMQILIKDLLTFSRVTSKAQPFVKVNLKNTVQEVLSDLEVAVERLQGVVEVGELPEIEADPMQMRQLFQNLIGNALKFHKMDVAPLVRIHGKVVLAHDVSDKEGNEVCHIVIEDNGIGFDEKYADRIFTVFQRLHGRSEYEGTGLGLAVCRKIIERHGGAITAKSSPGNGSKFLVTLPVIQNEAEHATDKIGTDKVQPQDDSAEDEAVKTTNRGMETSFMVPYP